MSVRNESRRVRSQRKSVDWGTMGHALGGAYECYAHISSFLYIPYSVFEPPVDHHVVWTTALAYNVLPASRGSQHPSGRLLSNGSVDSIKRRNQ